MQLVRTLICGAFALTLSMGAAVAQTVSIATLPQGSVWNTMGNVIAGAVREHGDIRMVVQPYGGNLAMMQAVHQGLAEFSINDINDVIVAVAGEADYRDNAQSELRVVAKLNALPVGLYVREDLGIDRIADLKGKRVSSGWNAFPIANAHVSAILTAGGLTYDDVVGVPVPGLIRGSDDLVSGRTDAAFFAVGGPKVAEVDAAVDGVRFLEIDSDPAALERIQAVRPAFYLSEVTPAPYRVGIEAPMMMVTWDNVLVAGAHVPDETVYALLAAMAEAEDALGEAYPPLRAFSVEAAYVDYPGATYHPGAVRFFEENAVAKRAF
ncbi:TAXI family TRAP transporter solute-binding subunit [Algihabitans albus]|uniref:TAXI family TRAP transporter solute-binding subunit n=1 Tax=Algihabitans albus TaxID=2164067 RepID=UPI000E5D725D|nr:TAXI family TRAP transporter solute-binding subunit [Algihabitans albus]